MSEKDHILASEQLRGISMQDVKFKNTRFIVQ